MYFSYSVVNKKLYFMKKIWIASTVFLMAAAVKVNAQTDTTNNFKRTDSTVTKTDTTYSLADNAVTKSTSVNTTSTTSSYTKPSATTERVHVGVRAGVNSSNIIKSGSGDVDVSTGAKLGLNAALFLEIPIIPAFSIQPEVQYSQKGYKSSGTYLTAPYEYKQTTNFIEVPLLAKFKPSPGFGIIIGPQFSFLTSTKTKFTVANTAHETQMDADNDNLRKNILGGVVGLEAAAGPLVFDLRYSLDFQKNNGDGSSTTPAYKNQVIALSVGVRL
jgi:hypothetical protein